MTWGVVFALGAAGVGCLVLLVLWHRRRAEPPPWPPHRTWGAEEILERYGDGSSQGETSHRAARQQNLEALALRLNEEHLRLEESQQVLTDLRAEVSYRVAALARMEPILAEAAKRVTEAQKRAAEAEKLYAEAQKLAAEVVPGHYMLELQDPHRLNPLDDPDSPAAFANITAKLDAIFERIGPPPAHLLTQVTSSNAGDGGAAK
ncbi:hypothetical protein [Streptomyces sp. NPDC127112]|uniref:hypothetical protein n=1 Tax=Streptomyces sp. NPDC127112 TaxID=3345364 RepID=UPI00362DB818